MPVVVVVGFRPIVQAVVRVELDGWCCGGGSARAALAGCAHQRIFGGVVVADGETEKLGIW